MGFKRLIAPKGHESSVFVAMVSGGKDSTATLCAMREAGIPHRAVFADTGWEAPETYEYLAMLERVFGIEITRVGAPGGMRAKIEERAGFPARKQRWCTRELKIDPTTEYCCALAEREGADIVQVLGIRAEESEDRARMAEFERDDSRDAYVWRPILGWTIADVLSAHHRAGIPVNPLYARGHNRVGCWPCIYAAKEEIRLVAEHDPARIAEIAELERACERERETQRRDSRPVHTRRRDVLSITRDEKNSRRKAHPSPDARRPHGRVGADQSRREAVSVDPRTARRWMLSMGNVRAADARGVVR